MSINRPVSFMTISADQREAKRNKKPIDPNDEVSIAGKVVVVTGASSGIGAAVAMEMARRGARVVMPCRDIEKGQRVVNGIKEKVQGADLTLVSMDLADLSSVRSCAAEIRSKFPQIQILINNAGIFYMDGTIGRTQQHGFEQHMGVNHLGTFLFTNLLLDLLVKGAPSRIVFTASQLYAMAELDLNDWMLEKQGVFGAVNMGPYANSKLATMYTTYSLAKRLQGKGVNTYALHPGNIRTNLHSNLTGIKKIVLPLFHKLMGSEPEEGAETVLFCALSNKCKDETGQMYRCNGLWEGAMEKALDDQVADKLWEMSEKAVAQN